MKLDDQTRKSLCECLLIRDLPAAKQLLIQKNITNKPNLIEKILLITSFDMKDEGCIQWLIEQINPDQKQVKSVLNFIINQEKDSIILAGYLTAAEVSTYLSTKDVKYCLLSFDGKNELHQLDVDKQIAKVTLQISYMANEIEKILAVINHITNNTFDKLLKLLLKLAISRGDIILLQTLKTEFCVPLGWAFEQISQLETGNNLNPLLLQLAADDDNLPLFKLLICKYPKITEPIYNSSREKIRNFLDYKPGKKQKTIYQYCQSAEFQLSHLKRMIEDSEATTSEESSGDESTTVEASLRQVFGKQTLDDGIYDRLVENNSRYIERFTKTHTVNNSDARTESDGDIEDLYATRMHALLYRGIHRGLSYHVEIGNHPDSEVLPKLIETTKKAKNKTVVLLNNYNDEWQLLTSFDDFKTFKVIPIKDWMSGKPHILLSKRADQLTKSEETQLRRIVRHNLNLRSKIDLLASDIPKTTLSPLLLQEFREECNTPFGLEQIDLMLERELVKKIKTIYQQLHLLDNQDDVTVNKQKRKLKSRLYRFYDSYVKFYGKLFNEGGIKEFGFEANPLVSTTAQFAKAINYATAVRNKNSAYRRDPHYRRSTGKPKHRFAGVVRAFLFQKSFENNMVNTPELIAKGLIYPGDRRSYEVEIAIKSHIPSRFYLADIPIFLPDISLSKLSSEAAMSLETATKGLEIETVRGDGHCFYYAISFYLVNNLGPFDLRRVIADHLQKDKERFIKSTEFTSEHYDEYVNNVRTKASEYADNVEIQAMQEYLRRPIIIIQKNGHIIIPDDDALQVLTGEPIFIYYDNVIHYSGCSIKSGFEATSILNTLRSYYQQMLTNTKNKDAEIEKDAIDKAVDKLANPKIDNIAEKIIKTSLWQKDKTIQMYVPFSGGYVEKRVRFPVRENKERYLRPQEQLTQSETAASSSHHPDFELEEVIRKLLEEYLIISYPNGRPRKFHDALHACNTSLWSKLFYLFWKKHGLNTELSDTEVDVVQLAGIMHDAGREGDGKDIWEEQSANKFQVAIEPYKNNFSEPAILRARNAISQKDNVSLNDVMRILIQAADCIEIMRCLPAKDTEFHLNYMNLYTILFDNITARTELENLVYEIAQLLSKQCNILREFIIKFTTRMPSVIRKNYDPRTVESYNNPDCYLRVLTLIKEFPILASYLLDSEKSILEQRAQQLLLSESDSDDKEKENNSEDQEMPFFKKRRRQVLASESFAEDEKKDDVPVAQDKTTLFEDSNSF